jgi:HEAT repeat protein
VAKALEHRDPGTRRLAVSALSTIGTPAALKLAARAVEDEDPEVRMTAFDAFTQRPFRGVARTLSTYLTTRDLEALDLSERRALFAAFAASNGPAGVPTLETVLLARGGLARRPSPQTRACAALALGMIDSPAARFALESATKEKDALVRSAAGTALKKEGVA